VVSLTRTAQREQNPALIPIVQPLGPATANF
jgi:hypothetical protein